MKMKKSAIKFYRDIQERKELSKYKIVNGLFIVKYVNKDECVLVGDFLKAGRVLNDSKTNLVLIHDNPKPQKFNKRNNKTTSGLGYWKDLNISFIERPIKDILGVV